MIDSITYDVGGYDPDHPASNVIAQTVDNGDGTGTRTTYLPDGTIDTVEQLTGLPIPPEPEQELEPDPIIMPSQIVDLQEQLKAQQVLIDQLLEALGVDSE